MAASSRKRKMLGKDKIKELQTKVSSSRISSATDRMRRMHSQGIRTADKDRLVLSPGPHSSPFSNSTGTTGALVGLDLVAVARGTRGGPGWL